jgi:hypothetical protein
LSQIPICLSRAISSSFLKEMIWKKKVIEPAEKAAPLSQMKGVDVSGLTNPKPWDIFHWSTWKAGALLKPPPASKLGLVQGDTAFVRFEKNADTIRKGQEFSIAKASSMIRHPLTDRPLGYIVATRGMLVIKERIKGCLFSCRSEQGFFRGRSGQPGHAGSSNLFLHPAHGHRSQALRKHRCPEGKPADIGQFSVVYLDSGFKDGVKRGSVFDLVKIIKGPVAQPSAGIPWKRSPPR